MEKSTQIKSDFEYPCYCCENNLADCNKYPCVLCTYDCGYDNFDERHGDYFEPIIVIK